MNVQLPVQMDKAAFLAWADAREGRYELVDGRVVMMVRPSKARARIVRNIVVLLDRQLDPARWEVVADFGVDAGPQTLRFPNVMIDRVGGSDHDLSTTGPVLLIEVLSPSARNDLGDKAAEFLRIPDLAGYIVFAQDKRKAWVWIRGSTGLPVAPDVLDNEGATIEIPALGVRLSMSEVYARIAFDQV
jgi:Uma2 family endonuclease